MFVVDGGEDVIDGGAGRDALDFSASVAGVQVDLSTGTLVDGEGFEDQFSSIEIVTGSTFDDTLLGGSGDDTFIGGDGSDVLVGGPDDGLPGTDADVAVFEGSKGSYEFGVDALSGSLTVTSKDTGSVDILEGIETLSFGDGPLTVSRPSSDAAFTLTGSDGADDVIEVQSEIGFVAEGLSGADTLIGGSGDDTLIGGIGDDVFVVDGGEDVIDGGAGRDALDFSASITGVQVDLSTGTLVDGEGFGDHFTSIEDRHGVGRYGYVGWWRWR